MKAGLAAHIHSLSHHPSHPHSNSPSSLSPHTPENDPTHQELPYNEMNKIISEADVLSIFQRYELDAQPINIDLYRTAMVHRSYCTRKNENFLTGNTECPENCIPLQEESYERLEFLGDTVIATIIGNYAFDRFPERENEGFLTKMRTKLVNGNMLAHLCSFTQIPKFIIISKQIESNNGRLNKKILEDCFEAFMGAMFKDFCLQNQSDPSINPLMLCDTWLINLIENNVDFTELILSNTNYKDQFLKYYINTFNETPKFYEINCEVTATGKRYEVCAKNSKMAIISSGVGSSKKIAENDAALNALQFFGEPL